VRGPTNRSHKVAEVRVYNRMHISHIDAVPAATATRAVRKEAVFPSESLENNREHHRCFDEQIKAKSTPSTPEF
jgi:hypothetical protein